MIWPDEMPTTVNGYSNLVADYIEEYGHCQTGDYSDSNGAGCVMGADGLIAAHYGVGGLYSDRTAGWRLALYESIDPRAATYWSDNTPTPEVIATLRSLGAAPPRFKDNYLL